MSGIYVHIPFCKSRCNYCDFYSTTLLQHRSSYIDAVIQEWNTYCIDSLWTHPQTLYIGGGTPSLLAIDDIERLIHAILSTRDQEGMEITIEANPGDLDLPKLKQLRHTGINRLSLGIQSFNDTLLQTIGRRHSAMQAQQAYEWAKDAGFENISIDLMYGLPGQSISMLQQDIELVLSLHPQHISTYCLSYEEGTPFMKQLEQGILSETEEDVLNEMYDDICSRLTDHGYQHYEVSNFSLPGMQSRHNSAYWDFTPYLGLGAAAHSFNGEKRWWNPANLQEYITSASNLQRESENLTDSQHRMEQIMLGLRTAIGIDVNLVDANQATSLLNQNLLYSKDGHYIATQKGIHVLNQIINKLV